MKRFSIVDVHWKYDSFGFSMENETKDNIAREIHNRTLDNFAHYLEHLPSIIPHNSIQVTKQEYKNIEQEIDDFLRDMRYMDTCTQGVYISQCLEIFASINFLSHYVQPQFDYQIKIKVTEHRIQYVCEGCQRPSYDKLKKCGGCKSKTVYFCSKECQIKNWPKHINDCEYTKYTKQADKAN
jgi:CRISPR/Cas system CMR-associated protein Cmr5 small subunit